VIFDLRSGFVQLSNRRLRAPRLLADRGANRSQRAFSFGGGLGEGFAERLDALRDVAFDFGGRRF
jgi:hypothetical protein